MRISDWSSDVCSSDLKGQHAEPKAKLVAILLHLLDRHCQHIKSGRDIVQQPLTVSIQFPRLMLAIEQCLAHEPFQCLHPAAQGRSRQSQFLGRSEERRGGTECFSSGRSRWSPYHLKKNKKK